MLLNNFFFIDRTEQAPGTLKAFVRIDKTHAIFEGHFPAIPIVPGVCMMEIMKEIMEYHLEKKMMVSEADNMKFLAVINPTEHSELQADIQYEELPGNGVKINAVLFSGSLIFFKLKALFTAVS